MFSRYLTRTTFAALAVGCLALGVLAASSTPTLAATPTATATPFASATATRDNLLTVAKTAIFKDDNLVGFGVFPAWAVAYPGVSIDGHGILATGSNISSYTGSLYPKDSKNPIAIAFALKDATGACAAGAMFGSGSFTTFKALTLPSTAACSGQSALDALRLEQPLATATATATATTTATASATTPAASATTPTTIVAPRPPTTGSGPAPDSTPMLTLVAAGIVLLLGGSMTLALRRR